MPLLIGAAVGWDRFASARGPAAWRGPVCMGLAMAVKQTPWLVLPFVIAGIVVESRQRNGTRQAMRDGLRYLGIAFAAFAVPNLPYFVAAPGAWLNGILTPLSSHMVPAGQGLVDISLSLMAGGGSLTAYNVAAVVVFAAMLACYVTTYPALKPAAFLLPSVALFFAEPLVRQLPCHARPGGAGGGGHHGTSARDQGGAELAAGCGRRRLGRPGGGDRRPHRCRVRFPSRSSRCTRRGSSPPSSR